jgi:hypothetical protein
MSPSTFQFSIAAIVIALLALVLLLTLPGCQVPLR